MVLNHDEDPGSSQDSRLNKPPLKDRRLDSIASLIQGNDPCGATFFDGEHLVISTNNVAVRNSPFDGNLKPYDNASAKVLSYLRGLIQNIEELKDRTSDKSSIFQKITRDTNTVNNRFIRNTAKNQDYQLEVRKALWKIIDSIFYTVLDPSHAKALDVRLVNALAQGKILHVAHEEKSNNIHAEMKIVDHILQNTPQASNRRLEISERKYVGISKKCCPTCAAAFKALNTVLNTGAGLTTSGLDNRSDKTHGKSFPTEPPRFLTSTLLEFNQK